MLALGSFAFAKSVRADQGLPGVELMPMLIQHEADLRPSIEQLNSLVDRHKQAIPGGLTVQKEDSDAAWSLAHGPARKPAGRPGEALRRQVAGAETERFKVRARCVELLRKTQNPEQLARLSQLYLDGVR